MKVTLKQAATCFLSAVWMVFNIWKVSRYESYLTALGDRVFEMGFCHIVINILGQSFSSFYLFICSYKCGYGTSQRHRIEYFRYFICLIVSNRILHSLLFSSP